MIRPNFRVLKGIAVRDGLLSEHVETSTNMEMSFKNGLNRVNFLRSFKESFYVDLTTKDRSFTFIGKNRVVNQRLKGLFSFRDYSGSGPDIVSNLYEGASC